MEATSVAKSLLAVLAAVIALAACGAAAAPSPAASTPPPPSVTATAAALAGCQQATLVIGAVRSDLHADPSGTALALRQIQALGKSVPLTQLRLDVDRAALDLAEFRVDVLAGGPVAAIAKQFGADLNRIDADCGTS